MSKNPHRCVINAAGFYVDFVLLVEQSDGSMAPYAYELKSGETLIETSPPSGMIKPRRIGVIKSNPNGTDWEEIATPEEIAAAKTEPESQIVKESVSDLEIAFAEYVIETEQRLTDLEEKINA